LHQAIFAKPNGDEAWVLLLEKAMAKFKVGTGHVPPLGPCQQLMAACMYQGRTVQTGMGIIMEYQR
jgi:hypothetical protein